MSRTVSRLLLWTLAIASMVAFGLAGRWQLDRKAQKQAVLAAVASEVAMRTPKPLAVAADPTRAHGYEWAGGEGVFLDVPAVLLDNQQRNGRAGVRAYRAFDPGDAPALLVELGWLPVPGDRTMPAIPRPAGRMRVEGLLAPPPSSGIATAVAVLEPGGSVLTIGLDAANLESSQGGVALAPRVLKLDPALPLGYARDLDVLPNTLPPERHLGYAVQWFALALAVLVTALVLTFRPRRR